MPQYIVQRGNNTWIIGNIGLVALEQRPYKRDRIFDENSWILKLAVYVATLCKLVLLLVQSLLWDNKNFIPYEYQHKYHKSWVDKTNQNAYVCYIKYIQKKKLRANFIKTGISTSHGAKAIW
jgi:hypothetical protein